MPSASAALFVDPARLKHLSEYRMLTLSSWPKNTNKARFMGKCFARDKVGKKMHVGVLYKESELPQDFSAVSFDALKRRFGMRLDFHRYGQGGEGELGLQVFVIAGVMGSVTGRAALRRGMLCPLQPATPHLHLGLEDAIGSTGLRVLL